MRRGEVYSIHYGLGAASSVLYGLALGLLLFFLAGCAPSICGPALQGPRPEGALWTGADLIICITNTNDFQWSKVDTCVAVYPGYRVKHAGGAVEAWPNPPYVLQVIGEAELVDDY
jgi:hypothetical protein